jgi:hypothetical protein
MWWATWTIDIRQKHPQGNEGEMRCREDTMEKRDLLCDEGQMEIHRTHLPLKSLLAPPALAFFWRASDPLPPAR